MKFRSFRCAAQAISLAVLFSASLFAAVALKGQAGPSFVLMSGFEGSHLKVLLNGIAVFEDSVEAERGFHDPVFSCKLPRKNPKNYLEIFCNGKQVMNLPINMKVIRRNFVLMVEAVERDSRILAIWYTIRDRRERIAL